ncbi:transposase [Klebsiella pneumoniae]|nr:transposase [Klebsiella pneumoniae]
MQTADTRLLSKKSREFLLDGEGNILIDRYEWFLYQQIPDRLNGQLTLPDITKYRALDADLIDGEHWRKNKYTLLQQSHFTKLAEEPEKLIKQMAMELDTRLYEVGEYLEQEDNRNIILRNPQGKRFWRLPSASKFPQRGLRMYCAWLIVTPVSLTASLMCWVPNPEAVPMNMTCWQFWSAMQPIKAFTAWHRSLIVPMISSALSRRTIFAWKH